MSNHETNGNAADFLTKALEDAINRDPRATVMGLGAITEAILTTQAGVREAIAAAATTITQGLHDAIRSTTQADYALTQGAQMEAGPDPAAPGFADLVTDTARALWKADPGNRTAARTFDEDYAASQDRYTEMARRFLDPTEDGTR